MTNEANNFSNPLRAEVLTQALPYIRKYRGKRIVVKYGGNAMIDEKLKQQVMEDIVLLWLIGVEVVLIHGGGPDIDEMMKKLGKAPTFIDGLRVTDAQTVEIVQMVLAGKVNKSLVNLLQTCGGNAVGISGIDGKLIEAQMRDEKLGYVGKIEKINPRIITDTLAGGYIPVIATVGGDGKSNTYNVNGDTAAAEIAGALGAERLIMMTNVPGIMTNIADPDSLIASVSIEEATQLVDSGVISGGMIPKLQCCINAIAKGVENVVIMDGRIPHAILMELLTDEGAGTMITRGAAAENRFAAESSLVSEEGLATKNGLDGKSGFAAETEVETESGIGAAKEQDNE